MSREAASGADLDNGYNKMTTTTSRQDAQAPDGFRVVEISREPIELYKILKFEGMATSGGQAKAMVAAGNVLVNGQSEAQKRKKIVSGDTIEFNGDKVFVKLSSSISDITALPEHNVDLAVEAPESTKE